MGSDAPNFETALVKLEEIVRKLEEGNITLDESIVLYTEGVKLLRTCEALLHKAEGAIEVLGRGDTERVRLDEGD